MSQHAEQLTPVEPKPMPNTLATALTKSARLLPTTILLFDKRSDRLLYQESYCAGLRNLSKDSLLPPQENGKKPIIDTDPQTIRIFNGLRDRGLRLHSHVWPVSGGTPITEATAITLRQIVFGQCPTTIRTEYFARGPGFSLREPERDMGFALSIGHSVVAPIHRALLMTVQTYILKALLFEIKINRITKPDPLKPTESMQKEAIISAVTDIIWQAGDEQCVICLPNADTCHVPDSDHFNRDGVTEKLHLFRFESREELYHLVRRHANIFEEDPGPALILIIYSAILSRGIDRVLTDMGARLVKGTKIYSEFLLSYNGDIHFNVLNLLLNGKATPYLHNGIIYDEDEDQVLVAKPGITMRATIGLLLWMRTEKLTQNYNLGSRLKTPVYPIWLVIAADKSGVLFSVDRDLLRDYRSEIRFNLNYLSSSQYQTVPAEILIRSKPSECQERSEDSLHILDRIIRTKWLGARVEWNGKTPIV